MRNLKLTAVLVIAAMALAALTLSACGGTTKDDRYYDDLIKQIVTPTPGQVTVDKTEGFDGAVRYLTITTQEYYMNYFIDEIEAYTELHPGVVISLNILTNDGSKYTDMLTTALMADKVGDIVHLPININYKLLTGAYFADLYPLMANSEFNPDNYFMNIINAYAANGKLYALCSSFDINNGYMMRNDISDEFTKRFETEVNTYNDLIDLYIDVAAYQKASGVTRPWQFTRDFTPNEVLMYNYDVLIDFDKGKASFTNPEFLSVLEKVKSVPIDNDLVYYRPEGLSASILLSNQWNLEDLTNQYNRFIFKDGGFAPDVATASVYPAEERILTMPKLISTAGGNYLFTGARLYAVSKNSADKELAWDFLMFLMRDEEPSKRIGTGSISYMRNMYDYSQKAGYGGNPVNKHNFEILWTLYAKYHYVRAEELELHMNADMDMNITGYAEYGVSYVYGIVEKLNLPNIKYNVLYINNSMIWPDMYLYLTGKQNAETTMRNIQNKVELWLNE